MILMSGWYGNTERSAELRLNVDYEKTVTMSSLSGLIWWHLFSHSCRASRAVSGTMGRTSSASRKPMQTPSPTSLMTSSEIHALILDTMIRLKMSAAVRWMTTLVTTTLISTEELERGVTDENQ